MRGIKLTIMCVALVMSVGVAILVSQLVSGGGTDRGHEVGTVARPSAPATGETSLAAGSALATPDRPASPPTLTGQAPNAATPAPLGRARQHSPTSR